MTMQLYFMDDGVKLDLNADGLILLDGFYPETATDQSKNVTDQFSLAVRSSNLSGKIEAINRVLAHARLYPSGDHGVYLFFGMTEADIAWRTRVVDGAVLLEKSLGKLWGQNKANITVALEHLPYWEGEETAVPLTNLNGTNVTTGITVYNCNDNIGTSPNRRCNYVMVNSTYITGDLPTPPRIEFTNTDGTKIEVPTTLRIGWHVRNSGFTWNYEAENSTYNKGTVVSTDDTYSNSAYREFTLNGDDHPRLTNLIKILSFPLSSGVLAAGASQWYKVLIYLNDPVTYNDMRMQVSLYWPSGGDTMMLQESQAVILKPGHQIYEIGALQIPPWMIGVVDPVEIDLVISGWVADTYTFGVDFVQLFPAAGYRTLTSIANTVFDRGLLVDDGITDAVWVVHMPINPPGQDDQKIGAYVGLGNRIYLHPNKLQYLYFLQELALGASYLDIVSTVSIYYRPRRLTI
ncbi:MAG: hypothetical protein WA116_01060 [Anaerolineaceae bacterium]